MSERTEGGMGEAAEAVARAEKAERDVDTLMRRAILAEADLSTCRERLREILHAVRAWENDAPLDRDHPDDCDADFLRYIGRVARMDLSVDAGKPEANDER